MFADYIGQRDALAPLLAAIIASKQTGRALPHGLLLGPPGTGKTTLARAVADEMGQPFAVVHAPTVKDGPELAQRVLEAAGGILLLDEAHALRREHAESLFTLLDDGTIRVQQPIIEEGWDYVKGEPERVRCMVDTGMTQLTSVVVGDITILAATTDEALLPAAFLSRLSRLVVRLRAYTLLELGTIATLYAERELGLTMESEGAVLVAQRSRGVPRRVKQLTERAADYALGEGRSVITGTDATSALSAARVDELGLEEPHRAVLRVLSEHERGLSRTSLAQILGLPARSVDLAWGDLATLGLVEITNRHCITEAGRAALERRP